MLNLLKKKNYKKYSGAVFAFIMFVSFIDFILFCFLICSRIGSGRVRVEMSHGRGRRRDAPGGRGGRRYGGGGDRR